MEGTNYESKEFFEKCYPTIHNYIKDMKKCGYIDVTSEEYEFKLIIQALKLQELVKELFKYGLPISLQECGESMAKIQSLLENETNITNKKENK